MKKYKVTIDPAILAEINKVITTPVSVFGDTEDEALQTAFEWLSNWMTIEEDNTNSTITQCDTDDGM